MSSMFGHHHGDHDCPSTELKQIYQGFKQVNTVNAIAMHSLNDWWPQECPSGYCTEEEFTFMFNKYFPQGGKFLLFGQFNLSTHHHSRHRHFRWPDATKYAKLVFNTIRPMCLQNTFLSFNVSLLLRYWDTLRLAIHLLFPLCQQFISILSSLSRGSLKGNLANNWNSNWKQRHNRSVLLAECTQNWIPFPCHSFCDGK